LAIQETSWPPALRMFAGVQLADMGTTWVGLEQGYQEANLLPAYLLDVGGMELMYLVKVTIVLLVIFMVLRLSPRYPRLWHGVRISNVLVGLVVVSNIVQLLFF
jgi:uncharacterized membrane protein